MQAGGALSKAEFVFPFCARVRLDELGKLGFGNAKKPGGPFRARALLTDLLEFCKRFLVGGQLWKRRFLAGTLRGGFFCRRRFLGGHG